MTRVLITAFEPYDRWQANASWLALVELTRRLPQQPTITTRLYPVDYAAVRERLEEDLAEDFDVALHLGQAPGNAAIHLEAVGINVADRGSAEGAGQTLVEGGPVAYHSALPLIRWAGMLREAGIPARVSYHAGTYLCNAALYLSHHICEQHARPTRAAFVHLPLAPSQVLTERHPPPSMPSELCAAAIRLILAAVDEQPLG